MGAKYHIGFIIIQFICLGGKPLEIGYLVFEGVPRTNSTVQKQEQILKQNTETKTEH